MTTAFKVERRGRKRGLGRRKPSGDLVKQQEVEVARVIAFRQPHRQSVPEAVRDDYRAETFFGRLLLNGVITEPQYEAGTKYKMCVYRYRSHIMGVPNPNPASIAGFMQPSSGGGAEPDTARIREEYDDAVEVLMKEGQREARAVARVAVWDEWPVGVEPDQLHRGLNALSKYYRLTR